MTKFPEFFADLMAPFSSHEVKSRSQAGRTFNYVSARTVQNRFDNVAGPENWWPEYVVAGENGIQCRITVVLPDGSQVTKADTGGHAGMADSGDDEKSAYSDALKRAACVWGVGRYLWGDGVPGFVPARAPGSGPDRQPPDRERGHDSPRESYPEHGDRQPPRDSGNGNGNRGGNGQHQGPPRSGKALFAWVKEMEQMYEVDLLNFVNRWAKLQDWPGRMVDFTAEQVQLAHAEAVRKLQSVGKEAGSDG